MPKFDPVRFAVSVLIAAVVAFPLGEIFSFPWWLTTALYIVMFFAVSMILLNRSKR